MRIKMASHRLHGGHLLPSGRAFLTTRGRVIGGDAGPLTAQRSDTLDAAAARAERAVRPDDGTPRSHKLLVRRERRTW